MSTTAYDIDGSSWTAISAAGESGVCWVQKAPGNGRVVVNHSESGSGSLDENESYYMPNSNKSRTVPISADNVSDIFYAKCVESDEEAVLIADVI